MPLFIKQLYKAISDVLQPRLKLFSKILDKIVHFQKKQ